MFVPTSAYMLSVRNYPISVSAARATPVRHSLTINTCIDYRDLAYVDHTSHDACFDVKAAFWELQVHINVHLPSGF